MKNPKIRFIFLFVLCILFSGTPGEAQFFDDDEDKRYNRILTELKKISFRIAGLENEKLKALKNDQAEILSRVNSLRSMFPSLRGSLEQNEANFKQEMAVMKQSLADLASRINTEIETNRQTMESTMESHRSTLQANSESLRTELQDNLNSQLTQLQQALAGDMESLAQSNSTTFDGLISSNNEALGKIETQINNQNQTLSETQGIFQNELIPSIQEQNDKDREVLIAALNKGLESNSTAIQGTEQSLQAGIDLLDGGNKKMIEIMTKSLEENQKMAGQVNALDDNLVALKDHMDNTRKMMEKLREVLNAKVESVSQGNQTLHESLTDQTKNIDLVKENLLVAETKLNKLAESLAALQSQNQSITTSFSSMNLAVTQMAKLSQNNEDNFDKLVETSKELAKHTGNLEAKMDQSIKKIDLGLSGNQQAQENFKVTDDKLTKMIEVLQTVANSSKQVENQLTGSLQKMESSQASTSLTDEKVTKMIDILQTVASNSAQLGSKLDQSIQKMDASAQNAELADKKTTKMVEILQTVASNSTQLDTRLKESLSKLETTVSGSELMDQKMTKVIEILQQVAASSNKLETRLDEGLQRSQDSVAGAKVSDEKINEMIDLLRNLLQNSSQMEAKIMQSLQSAGSSGSTGTAMNEEKVNKMIDILQTIAGNDSQMDRKIEQSLVQLDKYRMTLELARSGQLLTDEKISKIIELLQSVAQNSSQFESRLEQSLQKISFDQQQGGVSEEKINGMIEILQTVLAHSRDLDQKLNRSLQTMEPGMATVDLANRKLSELINILKAIAVEQSKMEKLLSAHNEIKDRLEDLRRKANVNIDRNNNILKKIK